MYSKIDAKMHDDEKYKRLTVLQQYVFQYLITGKIRNIIGLYVLKVEDISGLRSADTKIAPKEAADIIRAIVSQGLIEYDWDQEVVWVKNFIKHHPITNPNQFKAAQKQFIDLPDTYLKRQFVDHISDLNFNLSNSLSAHLPPEDPSIEPNVQDLPPQNKEVNFPSTQRAKDAKDVFEYWKKVMNHPEAVFSPERRKKIEARLKNNDVEKCKEAIDGCRSSEYHMGANPHGKVFDSVDLIFRSQEKFEEFRNMAKKPKPSSPVTTTSRPPEDTTPKDPLQNAPAKFADIHAMLASKKLPSIKSVPEVLTEINIEGREKRKELLKEQVKQLE